MVLLRKRCLLAAAIAAIAILACLQPASAQNSGTGGDSFTRLLWRGTDGSASLWKLDLNLNFVGNRNYGAFDQWLPISLTVANNNDTYLLWRRTDGLANIWLLDSNLNFVSNQVYGPFPGWIAEHLSADTNGFSTLRLTWRNTNGAFAVWVIQPNLTVPVTNTFGPFFGFLPGQ